MQTQLNIAREFAKQDHPAKMIPDVLLPDIVPTPQDPQSNDSEFPRWEYSAGFIPDVLLP